MINNRLFQTTALRLALLYAMFFVSMSAISSAIIYWSTVNYTDSQIEIGLHNDLSTLKEIEARQGLDGLSQWIENRIRIVGIDRQFYLLLDPTGRPLAGNLKSWPVAVKADGSVHNHWLEDSIIFGAQADEDAFCPIISDVLPDGSKLLIATDLKKAEDLTEFTLWSLIITATVTGILTLFAGVTMGRKILGRVDGIRNTLDQIISGKFSSRIPPSGRQDEFDELSQRINAMLTRIEELMTGMREVTTSIAHDLRGPLNRIHSRLEVTLMHRRAPNEYREAMELTLHDLDGLVQTFNSLLNIARAESASYQGVSSSVDIAELAQALVELYKGLAEDKAQTLTLSQEGALLIHGDRQLLAQAIGNLLDNAIKFTPAGGRIQVRVKRDHDAACILVSDNGPGIQAADRTRVFDRFVRLDPARTIPGNGLGLSMVRAIVKVHQSTILLADNHPGLRIEIRIPISPSNAESSPVDDPQAINT